VILDCASVRTEPAYRAVARLIESKILKGEWSIGNSLPSELALAEGLGVNRSSLVSMPASG
jgi:GntR family transcriptional repressor for pyruvate dehydrogenase complex